MSKIAKAFQDNPKAFISFVTAGDPSLAKTKELILALEKAGSAIVEIGIPFSDPVAEGTVIQAASKVALSGNMTTNDIFNLVK